jgi:pSer/pThr/pTyr-binding forkhead associated (FHA) protein
MYKLVISDDEGRTTVVPLVRDEITIGREEGNTIRLTERNVSRKHARLSRVDGRFVLEDIGSYNGIKVNGSRMGTEVDLGAGDPDRHW